MSGPRSRKRRLSPFPRTPTAPAGRIGLLGGTLDPIHCGHLDAAVAARDAFRLDSVLIVPSHIPPHRPHQPAASPFHRFAMAALAVNGTPRLMASDDELQAAGPSYTADTLDRLHRGGWSGSQIFFIIGADAFAEIATWRRYPEVLDLASFVVVSRPGHGLDGLPRRLPALASRMRRVDSDTAVSNPSIFLLDAATSDVSSTDVRQRLQRGESIRGLVPSLVETHIRQHHLYQTVSANELHGQD
ncbi:MAG TPA: nicotinate-nucleotide adenylyltransferase [Vicinamibacterales bacterium]|jgi:nicotinate-nucleotide adenylyltransferase